MKKVTTTVAAALVALSFAACNKTNNSVTPEEGSASGSYASLTVSTNALPSLKAQPDNEVGRAAESTITTMDLVGNETKSWTPSAANGNGFWKDGNVYKTAPFEVSGTGNKKLGIVLNKGALTLPNAATFPTLTYGAKGTAIENIAALSTDGKFVMTSASAVKDIKGDKTLEMVKKGTSEEDNVFAFGIERVVAQGFVSKGDGLSETTTDNDGKVKLDDLTYSVFNGAAMTYVMADNAGVRHIDETSHKYANFKSAIHDKTFAEANVADVDFLVRIGQLGKTSNKDLGGYKAIAVNEAAYQRNGQESARGIYFLENSAKEDLTKQEKELGYARLATAKVYATFAPSLVYRLKAGATASFEAAPGSKVWYMVTTVVDSNDPEKIKKTTTYTDRTIADTAPGSKTETDENNVKTTIEWKEGRAIYGADAIEEDGAFQLGNTFYIGDQTGIAYSSIEAALAGHANTMVKTYEKGRCGYYSLWNRQPEKGVVCGDTRRNNIYSLKITAFKTRGFNFDPLDPNDPNLPKPNPKDPDNYPKPDHHSTNIEPTKTFMRVEAEILNWNFVERGTTLGE